MDTTVLSLYRDWAARRGIMDVCQPRVNALISAAPSRPPAGSVPTATSPMWR